MQLDLSKLHKGTIHALVKLQVPGTVLYKLNTNGAYPYVPLTGTYGTCT